MRLALTVVSPASRAGANLVLEAEAETEVGVVADELAKLAAGAIAPFQAAGAGGTRDARVLRFPDPRVQADGHAAVFVGGRPVSPQLTLAESPLREGCVVSLGDAAGCVPPEPTGIVEIRVAGGPAAGTVHRLNVGQADIGRGPLAHIRVDDPELPDHAVRVTVDRHGAVEVAPFDGVPATLDRTPLTAAAGWQPGMQLAVGASLLDLGPYEPPDAALEPSEDGAGLDFNRPPRLLPPRRETRFRLPAPPGRQDRRPLPILMSIVPLAMGLGGDFMFKSPYMLLLMGMSPVMMGGQYMSDRKQGRRSHARQQADYRDHKARIEHDAQAALDAERVQRRRDCPDPATVLTIASGPRRRLWERRRSDPDYLLLRIGTADLQSAVVLEDPTQDEHRRNVTWDIPDAPVTVALAHRGVLGVAGPGDVPRSVGRWLLA